MQLEDQHFSPWLLASFGGFFAESSAFKLACFPASCSLYNKKEEMERKERECLRNTNVTTKIVFLTNCTNTLLSENPPGYDKRQTMSTADHWFSTTRGQRLPCIKCLPTIPHNRTIMAIAYWSNGHERKTFCLLCQQKFCRL